MATHSSVLAWRIPGMGSLVGCRLWGRTESDTTDATWQHDKTCTAHTLQFLTRGFVVVIVVQSLNCVQLLATPWTVDDQTPLSTGCLRQGY